jgi:hypothetical protein
VLVTALQSSGYSCQMLTVSAQLIEPVYPAARS